jgi:hypothetical protein
MEPQATACGQALTDMEIKARELSNNGGLRSYLVVLRQFTTDGKMSVRSLCFTAPSWSHIAAKYDHPEDGVEIMKQEFLAMGEVSVLPLAWKGEMAELVDLSGLNMCKNCVHDFNFQPDNRCHAGGHRMDGEPAQKRCKSFSPLTTPRHMTVDQVIASGILGRKE